MTRNRVCSPYVFGECGLNLSPRHLLDLGKAAEGVGSPRDKVGDVPGLDDAHEHLRHDLRLCQGTRLSLSQLLHQGVKVLRPLEMVQLNQHV